MPPIPCTVTRKSNGPACPGSLAALDATPGVGTAHRARVLAHVPSAACSLRGSAVRATTTASPRAFAFAFHHAGKKTAYGGTTNSTLLT